MISTQFQSESKPKGKTYIPILPVNDYERLWLYEVLTLSRKGVRFTYKDIWTKLHRQLPPKFHPENIDHRLISGDGEKIYLLGVVALEENLNILNNIDKVILSIKELVLENPKLEDIKVDQISGLTALSVESVSFYLHLASNYGAFFHGWVMQNDSTIIESIHVGGNEGVYYQYVRFSGIEYLISEKINQTFEDYFEKKFEEAFVVDEDKDKYPFEPQKLLAIYQFLEVFENNLLEESQTEDVKVLLDETRDLKATIQNKTKSAVIKALSKLLAKGQKLGVKFIKYVLQESVKQLIKIGLEKGIDYISIN